MTWSTTIYVLEFGVPRVLGVGYLGHTWLRTFPDLVCRFVKNLVGWRTKEGRRWVHRYKQSVLCVQRKKIWGKFNLKRGRCGLMVMASGWRSEGQGFESRWGLNRDTSGNLWPRCHKMHKKINQMISSQNLKVSFIINFARHSRKKIVYCLCLTHKVWG